MAEIKVAETPALKPRVGLVTNNDFNRHVLQRVLLESGYRLAVSLDADKLNSFIAAGNLELDAWLVDIDGGEMHQAIDCIVEKTDIPLLVNDQVPTSNQDAQDQDIWLRRLQQKLEVVALSNTEQLTQVLDGATARLETVWVLAASFGGPDAVKRFLAALPADLPLAMVYGQHIEANFDGLLASALGNNHNYPMELVEGECLLAHGKVAVVPADKQLRFLAHGRVVATRKPWAGLYQPTLDQVISELARIYRQRLGVIIFSGMCNDGEIGCRVAKSCGATVWAQSPESCLSDDMPNAAISTGSVSFQGDPEQLASALVQHLAAGH